MEINSISKTDYPEIISLVEKEFPYTNITEENFLSRINSEKIFIFKLFDKELIGFVELELISEDLIRINGLAVKEKFRGEGYSKKLLGKAISFSFEKKASRIILWVRKNNDKAKKLYKEKGFQFLELLDRKLDNEAIEIWFLDLVI